MKDIYTTGEVAMICGLSQQTIIRSFDSGEIEGFLIPGSRFRRIPRDSLIRFMRENNIPIARLDGPKKKILVVEREPEIVDMLKDVLERDGRFEVEGALSGHDAIRLADQLKPDLVVLDFQLPDMNLEDVCSALRTNQSLKGIPIIVQGAFCGGETLDEWLGNLKADAFLQTPFRMDAMVAKVAELLHV
jgi:CheY-like chemotaxis protein